MDILLNKSKYIGFEPTDQGFRDLVEVSGLHEGTVKPAWDAAILEERRSKVAGECRRRIYSIASAEAQMNMASAVAVISSKTVSARSDDEKETLIGLDAAISWVTEMRATVKTLADSSDLDFSEDKNWPPIPPEVLVTVDKF